MNTDGMTEQINNTISVENLRNDKVQPLSQNKNIDFLERISVQKNSLPTV